jgi:hypothetical protein
MSDDEFKERVIALLEIIAFGPGDESKCDHEGARDLGVMGDEPGAHMYCPECKEMFSKLVEVDNG